MDACGCAAARGIGACGCTVAWDARGCTAAWYIRGSPNPTITNAILSCSPPHQSTKPWAQVRKIPPALVFLTVSLPRPSLLNNPQAEAHVFQAS